MSELISVRIDPELLSEIGDLAEERNLNRTQLIVNLCEEEIADENQGNALMSSDGR